MKTKKENVPKVCGHVVSIQEVDMATMRSPESMRPTRGGASVSLSNAWILQSH